MLLVTGATGQLGSNVVKQLLQKTDAQNFAVLARSAEKASHLSSEGIEVRLADFDIPETLDTAFKGISKILLISTMGNNRFEQHRNVIDAAVRSGVKHVVYTGLAIQDIEKSDVRILMESHFQTEDYLKQSGLNYTVLRNTMYADAIPLIIGEAALQHGIYLPGGNGKVPYVLRREIGEATANLLLKDGHINQTYNIVGSHAYSYQDIADELSKFKATKITYTDALPEEFQKFLEKLEFPEFLIYLTKGTVIDIKNKQYELKSDVLEKLLGRPSANLKAIIEELYS